MARRSFTDFGVWIRQIVNIWPQFGAGFTLAGEDENSLRQRSSDYGGLLSRINELESQLSMLKSERDRECLWMESFSVRLRAALLSQFGTDSGQLRIMPVLLKNGPGRPNKAAAARKAATIERRAKLENALKTQKIAEQNGE